MALSIRLSEQRTATRLWEIPHLSAASLADINSIAIPPILIVILYSNARIIAIPFRKLVCNFFVTMQKTARRIAPTGGGMVSGQNVHSP